MDYGNQDTKEIQSFSWHDSTQVQQLKGKILQEGRSPGAVRLTPQVAPTGKRRSMIEKN